MKTFVVPDIHGMFDLMMKGMHAIDKYSETKNPKIIFLGDYIDRGEKSADVVSFVRSGIESGAPWVALKGNHEDFMASAICDGDQNYGYSWMQNGGAECIASYYGDMERLEDDARWMKSLPIFHKDAHRVYVHAYAPHNDPIESAMEHDVLWTRYPKGADVGCMGLHVVHGHTPQVNGPELLNNRTNLDCGAVFTGRLVIGVFDDDVSGGPVDLIEVH